MKKILTSSTLVPALRRLRARGQKVVFTNGCFDILHKGHVRYLKAARNLGDVLVVGLNSDASVKRLKGDDRPLNSGPDRAEVLAALECVDLVCLFGEDTPERLIRSVKPDYLVKGGDWKKNKVVGADFVTSYGGQVRIIPYVKGFSTTGILEKIRSL